MIEISNNRGGHNFDSCYSSLDCFIRLYLPSSLNLLLNVTSIDVLHSYTIPSFGVKLDASPGRLNTISIELQHIGLYFGQCSELCGVNHSYIPSVLESSIPFCWLQHMINLYS